MPARWTELALQIHNVIDRADADLDDSDRQLFIDQAYRIVIARRKRRPTTRFDHPRPCPQFPPPTYPQD